MQCHSGAGWAKAGVWLEEECKRQERNGAASVHDYSLPRGAAEEEVSLTQKGNAQLKQENGTFF